MNSSVSWPSDEAPPANTSKNAMRTIIVIRIRVALKVGGPFSIDGRGSRTVYTNKLLRVQISDLKSRRYSCVKPDIQRYQPFRLFERCRVTNVRPGDRNRWRKFALCRICYSIIKERSDHA